LLASFPYQKNVAFLHTDTSILPRNRRAWASWKYRLSASGASVTSCMNILQHIHSPCVQRFLNAETLIDPSKIVRRLVYEHPVFTSRRMGAQMRYGELLDANRTSYCGAYWGNGFHEDGVVSALAVCNKLEGRVQGLPVGKSSADLGPASRLPASIAAEMSVECPC
jgi:predicted NAD/FAD-binding protein